MSERISMDVVELKLQRYINHLSHAERWKQTNRAKYLARKKAYYQENRKAIRLAAKVGISLADARKELGSGNGWVAQE